MSDQPAFDYTRLPSYVSVEGALYAVYNAEWSQSRDSVALLCNPILTSKPEALSKTQRVQVIQNERVTHTGVLSDFKLADPGRPVSLSVESITEA